MEFEKIFFTLIAVSFHFYFNNNSVVQQGSRFSHGSQIILEIEGILSASIF